MNHNQSEINDTFLFTSESVGEGHPGKFIYYKYAYRFFCYSNAIFV